MKNNEFTLEQKREIYSDQAFLEYFSSYFSTFDSINIDISATKVNKDLEDNWKLYIRIFLANTKNLDNILKTIERKPSYTYKKKFKEIKGGIKGRFDISKYVQKSKMLTMPKSYPCELKEKAYVNVENEYLYFIINNISNSLNTLMSKCKKSNFFTGKETEYIELKKIFSHIQEFKKRELFFGINENYKNKQQNTEFPKYKISEINTRISKGKVRNKDAYTKIFSIYDLINKFGLTWISKDNISLFTYDSDFDDKLFEIYNLYNIKNCFVENHHFELIEQNNLHPQMAEAAFKLNSPAGEQYEIYFQKGAGLYWNENIKQTWKYTSTNKYLRGIPDISVVKNGERKSLVIVDAKNKVRNKGENSDEIYKMIGYFSNFAETLSKEYQKYDGILIFRNDQNGMMDELINETGNKIITTSVGFKTTDKNYYKEQINNLCKTIIQI